VLDGLLLLQDKIASGDRNPAVVKPRTDPVPAAKQVIASERLRLGPSGEKR
jgi:NADH-quinone oxidoreductase subunit B